MPLVSVDEYHPALEVSVRLPRRRDLAQRGPADAAAATGSYIPGLTIRNYNYKKANFPLLYSLIATLDWTPIYELGLENSLDFFYNNLYDIIDYCVPRKRNGSNSQYVYPEWYTADIIKDIKLKSRLHKQYKSSGTDIDYKEFSACRARVKTNISLAEKQYKLYVQSQLQRDPKSFWDYANSKRGCRTPKKFVKDGKVMTEGECAEEFAKYFHSVYSSETAQLDVSKAIAEAGGENVTARIHLDVLQFQEVLDAINKLKPKKSAGPDGIPPYIFRDCRQVIAKPLHHIFNLCLKQAEFPERWKITRVVPVPKGKSCTKVDQYRPVAILSTAAKVLESAIHKSISSQVSPQLSDAQHGFRTGRSTTSNLLSHMTYLLPAVDGGGKTDSAYFDFKKAFDLVDNDVLLKKLAGFGFTLHLLKFFASYMTDRRQYVEYSGHRSEPYLTRSGVYQGSNLGPLQFILMINDLPSAVQYSRCLLFADDLKLSLVINEERDCARLQEDINRVVAWSKENNLQFNVSKCMTISFTRERNPTLHTYNIDGVPMVRVKEVPIVINQTPTTITTASYANSTSYGTIAVNDTASCHQLHSSFPLRQGMTYCNATYDSFLCWPPAEAGTTAFQHCPKARLSDTSRLAFRRCGLNGLWLGRRKNESGVIGWTNYTPCFPTEVQNLFGKVYDADPQAKFKIALYTRYMEIFGFSMSLIAILISVFILYHFRSLRNNRTKIHRNLFLAMTIQVIVRLVLYFDQAFVRQNSEDDSKILSGLDSMPYVCEACYILLEYGISAMFCWMFIEGLYLHNVVTANALRERITYQQYCLLGWGLPVIITTVWTVFTALHYVETNVQQCWYGYNFLLQYWICQGPRLGIILTNLVFLLNILRVLIMKLNQSENSELEKVRKAVRAALVLLPLLGITNVLNMIEAPLDGSVWKFGFWSYTTHFLRSFQGFFIALIYCFLNGEVRLIVTKYFLDWQTMRNDQRRLRQAKLRSAERRRCRSLEGGSTFRPLELVECGFKDINLASDIDNEMDADSVIRALYSDPDVLDNLSTIRFDAETNITDGA